MLTLSHEGHSLELQPNSLVIVDDATEDDYWRLSNEDLKVEFDGRRLYIHSPARFEHGLTVS